MTQQSLAVLRNVARARLRRYTDTGHGYAFATYDQSPIHNGKLLPADILMANLLNLRLEWRDVIPLFATNSHLPPLLYLRYIAGVSHAEAGRPEAALAHLTALLSRTDATDPLYIDARYQRGLMLHAVGHTEEGIAELSGLRPLLVQQYGADSDHVRSLDCRIEQLRRHTTQ